MKASKQRLRIDEIAARLHVDSQTIRHWEKEFNIPGMRTPGGRRSYKRQDEKKFSVIKELLHSHGHTIDSAKQYIAAHRFQNPAKILPAICQKEAQFENIIKTASTMSISAVANERLAKLHLIKSKLLYLRNFFS